MKKSGEIPPPQSPKKLRRRYIVTLAVFFLLLLTLIATSLLLFFTVFKPKDPKTRILSATVGGVAPSVTFPPVQIDINITLDLLILVENPNRASFKHSEGKTLIFYGGDLVGVGDLKPGTIPAKGSERVSSQITVDADKFVSDPSRLIGDILSGEVGLDTQTRVAGKVRFLGFIRRHVVAVVKCHVEVGFPDLRIKRQECKYKTKM